MFSSSVQYLIRTVEITPEILQKNRLIITVNEKINALGRGSCGHPRKHRESSWTSKEEEFKGYDYNRDKSTALENTIVTQGTTQKRPEHHQCSQTDCQSRQQ